MLKSFRELARGYALSDTERLYLIVAHEYDRCAWDTPLLEARIKCHPHCIGRVIGLSPETADEVAHRLSLRNLIMISHPSSGPQVSAWGSHGDDEEPLDVRRMKEDFFIQAAYNEARRKPIPNFNAWELGVAIGLTAAEAKAIAEDLTRRDLFDVGSNGWCLLKGKGESAGEKRTALLLDLDGHYTGRSNSRLRAASTVGLLLITGYLSPTIWGSKPWDFWNLALPAQVLGGVASGLLLAWAGGLFSRRA